ncbi:AAA family ATPase [Bariatricus sp. SGI.154]|uniref:AAA family ATPase n=1 Tax=Bariatricus sp. SGI.154 TaxID=3420549 RepID=UPI003D062B26
MARTIGIGHQDFETIRKKDNFYIDKTRFIREWWQSDDIATLITRPRRFGKTLTMSMVEQFFSVKYAGRADLFQGLDVWKEESYRHLQGTYPVISLTFANVKEPDFQMTKQRINQILTDLYSKNIFLLEGDLLTAEEKTYFHSVTSDMNEVVATMAIHKMSDFLSRYYGQKVIILLDEYDTPMQEAYVNGYWEELVSFTRSLFNAAFKTNPYLERAILTGITRVSKESVFSDLNNLEVITTTSTKYEDSFGFTESEVYTALEEYGLSSSKELVKSWYDGFIFGRKHDIYNPWSIINYLDKQRVDTYWANTSSNSLISKLLRESNKIIKQDFEKLLLDEPLTVQIDEQIVYNQLSVKDSSVWSLLLASGYLKAENTEFIERTGRTNYVLTLTNREVRIMFENIIHDWFSEYDNHYNDFITALLLGDIKAMNAFMNKVALSTFSFFDTGKHPSGTSEPERFYHGFVLGLIVDLEERYIIRSNRESGFGRYDVVLEPKNPHDDGIILEFKVHDSEDEPTLKDTAINALTQIEKMNYQADLEARGIPADRIRKYGFAFEGKTVLIC